MRPEVRAIAILGAMKAVLAAAVAAALAGLLVVLIHGARERAHLAHCRSNLRRLGERVRVNWRSMNPEATGRAFWQELRVLDFRHPTKGWIAYPDPDPFLCPVLGRTVPDPANPEAIDYRGPRRVDDQSDRPPREVPIGADRPGNHPDGGGFVLRYDGSVDRAEPVVGGEPAWWERAASALSD